MRMLPKFTTEFECMQLFLNAVSECGYIGNDTTDV